MYDFSFGDKDYVLKNQEDFLIFCKRLLPRWINGIPDSECLAIYRILQNHKKEQSVLIETGCGASSLALFLHASLTGSKVYSWDTNGSKGALLRSVISDAMCKVLEVDLHKIWQFIAFDSTNPHIGVNVLSELGIKADFGFFDSWHTLDHLMSEIKLFEEVVSDNFIIALDDAYYRKRHDNYSYINMLRKKIGLGSINEPDDNLCNPFYFEVQEYMKKKYPIVEKIDDTYKKDYKNDIFFKYYEGDRNFMNALGMEEKEKLEHRFDAWRIKR